MQSNFEKRLLLIPVLYIFLRMWDNVQVVTSIVASKHVHGGCVSASWKNTLFALGIIQVRLYIIILC